MQATMPIGFRKELATVRYYQLNLARERARLQDEELEVSHQVVDALRQLELNYQLTETNFNRTIAADRQVEAVQAAFEAETVTLDQLLEAQRRRSEAQTSYFRTLLDYQRAIITIHYRKGSLLEYDNVYLTEGPWPAKAQFDAHRLARQRDASVYLNYGFTRPDVSSQGAIRQMKPGDEYQPGGMEAQPFDGTSTEAQAPEELPTPAAAPPGSSVELNTPLRVQTAAAVQRGFEWGPLGLASDAGDLDKLPEFDSLDQEPATTVAKPAPPKKNGPVRSRETSLVQPVAHQEQLPSFRHESLENQPPRPAARAAPSRPLP
jgi:hypothetical protein